MQHSDSDGRSCANVDPETQTYTKKKLDTEFNSSDKMQINQDSD